MHFIEKNLLNIDSSNNFISVIFILLYYIYVIYTFYIYYISTHIYFIIYKSYSYIYIHSSYFKQLYFLAFSHIDIITEWLPYAKVCIQLFVALSCIWRNCRALSFRRSFQLDKRLKLSSAFPNEIHTIQELDMRTPTSATVLHISIKIHLQAGQSKQTDYKISWKLNEHS